MTSGMQLPPGLSLDDPNVMFALGFALGGKLNPSASNQMDAAVRQQVPVPQVAAPVPHIAVPDAQLAMFGQQVSAAQLKDIFKMDSFRQMAMPQPMTQVHPMIGFMPQVQQTAHAGFAALSDDIRAHSQLHFPGAHSLRTPHEQFLAAQQLSNFPPQPNTSTLPYAQLCNFQMATTQSHSVKMEDSVLQNTHTGASEKIELVTPRNRRKQEDRGPIALTRAKLEELFNGSLQQASKTLGICPTAIKKACRRFGISKWPYKSPNPGPKPKRLRAMMAADGPGFDAKEQTQQQDRAPDKDDETENSESESAVEGEDSNRNSPLANATGKLTGPRIAIAAGDDPAPTLLGIVA